MHARRFGLYPRCTNATVATRQTSSPTSRRGPPIDAVLLVPNTLAAFAFKCANEGFFI
jgi:hypothetical protein